MAFDAATCIGCGACVASCKNSSAMLYVSAKVSQFALLPQGQVEAKDRVLNMVNKMDEEGFEIMWTSTYNYKNAVLTIPLDAYANLEAGEKICEIEVEDERKNKQFLTYNFLYK